MKKYFFFILVAAAMLAGCDGLPDNSGTDPESGGPKNLCSSLNMEIRALQAAAESVLKQDYVADIKPIKDGGSETGYSLDFGLAGKMSIRYGKGGTCPHVGVRMGEDGSYFWTLGGERLMDGGADVPELKMENDLWYISCDGGKTWEEFGPADDEAGQSMFREVSYDKESVHFTLQDGTVLKAGRFCPIDVTFDREVPISMEPYSTIEVGYTVTSIAKDVTVGVMSSADLEASLIEDNGTSGKIRITSGRVLDESSRVRVIASGGNASYTYTLDFVPAEGDLFELLGNEALVPADGGTFEVTVLTNVEYALADTPDWVRETEKREDKDNSAVVHVFKADANTSEEVREGYVTFRNGSNGTISFTVKQKGMIDWDGKSFHHRSTAIRFTADWCGYCPNMADGFAQAAEAMGGNLEVISLHCEGALAFNNAKRLMGQYRVGGYPTGIIDGRMLVENYPVSHIVTYTKEYCEQTASLYGTACGLAMSSSVEGKTVSVNIEAYLRYAETYKITVLLVEDNIVGWQANFVTGDEEDYVHKGVPRVAVTNVEGASISSETGREVKALEYSATVPNGCKIDNMRLVVYVQRAFGSREKVQSADYGDYYIDNCISGKVGGTVDLKFAEN